MFDGEHVRDHITPNEVEQAALYINIGRTLFTGTNIQLQLNVLTKL
jgi:hypothetical protein